MTSDQIDFLQWAIEWDQQQQSQKVEITVTDAVAVGDQIE